MKICLLVEDDPPTQEILKLYLESTYDLQCHAVSTVKSSLILMGAFKYPLIMVDYILTDGYGHEVFKAVPQVYQDYKPTTILLTAFPEALKMGKTLGATHVFPKPFQLEQLDQVLETIGIC